MIVTHTIRSDAFAGVERYVASVAPALAERGVDVRVIGGDAPRMRGAMSERIAHTPAATTTQVAWALARGGSVDIVHAHMTAAEIASVATASRHRGAIVSTRHFCGPRGSSPFTRAIAPLIRRRIAQQISVSDVVARSIGESSVVIPNGVPETAPGGHTAKTVLVLQRLEREKHTDVALRAWAAATARHLGWTLEIAGAGSQLAELSALVSELGIADSVVFLGHVGDAAQRVGAASILLATAPSEPFGLSVVEAMAAGTPVVAAAGAGHLETVGSCTTSHLFRPDDVDDCARQLDRLVADSSERRSYGEALRARQQAAFDVEGHADALVKLYEQLV